MKKFILNLFTILFLIIILLITSLYSYIKIIDYNLSKEIFEIKIENMSEYIRDNITQYPFFPTKSFLGKNTEAALFWRVHQLKDKASLNLLLWNKRLKNDNRKEYLDLLQEVINNEFKENKTYKLLYYITLFFAKEMNVEEKNNFKTILNEVNNDDSEKFKIYKNLEFNWLISNYINTKFIYYNRDISNEVDIFTKNMIIFQHTQLITEEKK